MVMVSVNRRVGGRGRMMTLILRGGVRIIC